MENTKGRVTIPTDIDVVPETLELMDRWGADAIRDCDGTDYPEELKDVGAKVYSTYYTTRKDNTWAKANPDEIQQMYIMTPFYTAVSDELSVHLMDHLYPDMLKVNDHDDIKRWWEVIDRTTGEVVPAELWSYDSGTGDVTIRGAKAFHDYTVSFLAYIMWDPVHMYNAVTNGWTDFEKQITFDVRQPKTHRYSMERLRKFIAENPHVDVIRYTTFFHQFTLIFDELAREKYVDWYGYSASVSPYILEQFEREAGYKFRPEFINRIDEIILFHKLDKNCIKDIAKIMITNIEKRLSEHKIKLKVNDAAFIWIVNNGYDPVYGARPLKRLLKTQIENKLAMKILSGEINDEDTAEIIVGKDGQLDIVKGKRKD